MIFLGRILLLTVSALFVGELIYGLQMMKRLDGMKPEPITVGDDVQKALDQPGKIAGVVDSVLKIPIDTPTPADRVPPPLPKRPKLSASATNPDLKKNAVDETKVAESTANELPKNLNKPVSQNESKVETLPADGTVVTKPSDSGQISELSRSVPMTKEAQRATPPPPQPRPEGAATVPPTAIAAAMPSANVPDQSQIREKLPVVRQPEPFQRPALPPANTPKALIDQSTAFLREIGATVTPAQDAQGQTLPDRLEVSFDPSPNGGVMRLNLRQQKNLAQALADLGPSLYSLSLRHVGLGNLANLGSMLGLLKLDLTGSDFLNISPLTQWPLLENLNVSQTHVDNMNLVSQLRNLRVLNLSDTNNFDVGSLATLAGLEELYLSGTRVASISVVSSLPRLKVLDLSGTMVVDLLPLNQSSQLQRLSLARTGVADMRPLSGCVGLVGLDLSQCQNLRDISGIEKLWRLDTLSLFGVPTSDLAPLAGCTSIRTVELSTSGVTSLDGLKPLKSLESVYARGLRLNNASALLEIGSLKLVDLSSTSVSAAPSLEEIQKTLESRGVQVRK